MQKPWESGAEKFLVQIIIHSSNSSVISNSRVGEFVGRGNVAKNKERKGIRDKSADETRNYQAFVFKITFINPFRSADKCK